MKQILYRIKSLFLLVAIAGGISACADDKGNYNYHDIPEVKGADCAAASFCAHRESVPKHHP